MAAALEAGTGEPVTLVEGGGGVFAVVIDGAVVFSKAQTGRFPTAGEIAALVRGVMD